MGQGKKSKRVVHIHLVSTDKANLRGFQLTNGEKGEAQAQWSPDGASIAFLSDRSGENGKGGPQLYTIGLQGGEAVKVTGEENPVTAFTWSPDSRSLAFVTRDVPKDQKDREKRKKDKFDAVVVDGEFLHSHLWRIDLESGAKKRLTEGNFTVASPKWSPNGKWIAYSATPVGWQESAFTDISQQSRTDLYVVPAEGGSARQLTNNPGADSDPEWSRDGAQIAYLARANADAWAAKTDVMVVPLEGGVLRNLTAAHIESAANHAWAGNRLVFSSPMGVYTHLFEVNPTGGAIEALTQGNRLYNQVDHSADGKNYVYVQAGPAQLADLYLKDGTRLTNANPQFAAFALGTTEVLRWKGQGGLDVEGLLVYPVDYQPGKKYPFILQIHGGPYGRFDASFAGNAQVFASKGYAVLMPNPRGSIGYGLKFTRENVADWGGRDFQDLMAGVDAVVSKGVADPERLVVMGGSYGGFMTFWTITQTNRFKAAIGHAAIADWYSFYGQSDIPGLMEYGFSGPPWTAAQTFRKYSPMTYIDKVKTPILITHGEQDRRVPIAQGEQYYRSLRQRGVEARFIRYPREGHGIQEPNHQIDLSQRQLDWFNEHLGLK